MDVDEVGEKQRNNLRFGHCFNYLIWIWKLAHCAHESSHHNLQQWHEILMLCSLTVVFSGAPEPKLWFPLQSHVCFSCSAIWGLKHQSHSAHTFGLITYRDFSGVSESLTTVWNHYAVRWSSLCAPPHSCLPERAVQLWLSSSVVLEIVGKAEQPCHCWSPAELRSVRPVVHRSCLQMVLRDHSAQTLHHQHMTPFLPFLRAEHNMEQTFNSYLKYFLYSYMKHFLNFGTLFSSWTSSSGFWEVYDNKSMLNSLQKSGPGHGLAFVADFLTHHSHLNI